MAENCYGIKQGGFEKGFGESRLTLVALTVDDKLLAVLN